MHSRHDLLAYLGAAIVGAAVWLIISYVTELQEAWDSSYYYLYGLPVMVFVSGSLGLLAPVRVWRWGLTVVGTQAFIAIIINPMANLLPLGLVVFGLLSLPCIAAAYLGAFIRNKVWW